jgi:hypothetical protein
MTKLSKHTTYKGVDPYEVERFKNLSHGDRFFMSNTQSGLLSDIDKPNTRITFEKRSWGTYEIVESTNKDYVIGARLRVGSINVRVWRAP